MSMLRSIESKLESLFEGVFGRAFRANVQPVELARKLAKEMDEHRNVSVSRVYVPNEYTIYLSTADREQFSGYEDQLRGELGDYLSEHARRESYVLLSGPAVRFETDEDLEVGVFGIATRMAQPDGKAAEPEAPAAAVEPGATMVYKPAPVPGTGQPTEAASPVDLGVQREVAVLSWNGTRHEISKRRVVIGRSKDADIRVDDPNVSRRHAEVQQEGATWWLVDLDSTNGVEVQGRRVKRLKLEDGTRFTIGSTEIAFSRELQ
jgi:FHA domain-containing protein